MFRLLKQTVQEFLADDGLRLAAALAFYTVLSLAPLLLALITLAGLFIDPHTVQTALIEHASATMGAQAAQQLRTVSEASTNTTASLRTAIVGGLTLFIGATGVVNQLKDALNTIWDVQKTKQGLLSMLRTRLLSLSLLVAVAFVLVVSFAASALLSSTLHTLRSAVSAPILWLLNAVILIAVLSVLFACSFKILADRPLAFRQLVLGATFTATLFVCSKELLAWYIGRSAAVSAYGAAGSLLVLLLWVYYASIIFLFGAEFTQVHASARTDASPQ